MDKEIFVISEGTTDFELLKSLVTHCGQQIGKRYRVKPLWPGEKFAQAAGWSSLKNWCLEQAKSLEGSQTRMAAAILINPRLQGQVIPDKGPRDKIGAALAICSAGHRRQLIIQLDADIAHHLVGEVPALTALPNPLSVHARKQVCNASIVAWLGGHSAKVGTSILTCITTMSLETWILATHDQSDLNLHAQLPIVLHDYDHITMPEATLLKLGYSGGGGKLKKVPSLYRTYAGKLLARLEESRARSTSLNEFCGSVIT